MRCLSPLLFLLFLACENATPPETPTPELAISSIDTFPFAASIRALEVVDENTVWWAGSNGLVGHTTDGGKNWAVDTLLHEGEALHFRSVAVTKEGVFVLSIASPALLYKSADAGQSWQLVYQEDDPAAFYDAMQFWDAQNGIAMGDPTDGCLSIILTKDGGDSWAKIPCDQLPAAAEGEAAFAASNSNIAVYGDHAWVVTGGAKARVLRTADRGNTWTLTQSPLPEGGQMTGIYSVAFWDESRGILFGGDWNDKANNQRNKAVTTDGGSTWRLVADGAEPGFRSSVKYFPQGRGERLIAVGIPGISVSQDGGHNWQTLSTQSWYAASFAPGTATCWLSGNGKIGRIRWR